MAGSPLVKVLGAGIGLASEAIHHSRAKKNAVKERTNSSDASSPASPTPESPRATEVGSPLEEASRSIQEFSPQETPTETPNYTHAPAYAPAYEAVAGPSTAPSNPPAYLSAETEKNRLSEKERANFAEEAFGIYDDEAIWELDDMAEYVDPPAYSEVDDRDVGGVTEDTSALQISSSDSINETDIKETETEETEEKVKKEIRMVRELVRMAGPVPTHCQRLPCPIIIPQRRPGTKGRGFVRAYAPVLGDCAGIHQDLFLKFLKDWYQASKASAWIDVVYVAAGIVGFLPEVSAQIVSIVVQVVAGTARELQTRHRANSFLDRANQELFMPRGLFAMVMAFKEEVPAGGLGGGIQKMFGKSVVSAQRLDLNSNTVKYSQMTALTNNSADANTRPKFRISNLRESSGAHTEVELPQAADLVYPDLDRVAERDLQTLSEEGQTENRNKWNSAGKFVQDYLDRRAQAAYEAEHRGSSTAVPADARKPFMSRYADPNHAANSGSLVALLTGGAVVLPAKAAVKTAARERMLSLTPKDESGQSIFAREFPAREPPAPGMKRGLFGREKPVGLIGTGIGLIASGAGKAIEKSKQKMSGQTEPSPAAPYAYGSDPSAAPKVSTGRKKIMQKDVLYLMVVNLPTDEEIATAMAQLEQLSKK